MKLKQHKGSVEIISDKYVVPSVSQLSPYTNLKLVNYNLKGCSPLPLSTKEFKMKY
jgi:hypothetical protein